MIAEQTLSITYLFSIIKFTASVSTFLSKCKTINVTQLFNLKHCKWKSIKIEIYKTKNQISIMCKVRTGMITDKV